MSSEADRDAERDARIELLREELHDQKDRGVVIVGSAWVEEELKASLKDTLMDDESVSDEFLSRVAFGHLINLARLLGIVTPDIAADLHCIRELRNEFAHNISSSAKAAPANTPLSFETRDIRSRCLGLRSVAHKRPKNPRDAFILACIELTGGFVMQRYFVSRIKANDFGAVFARPIPPKVKG